MLNFESSNLKIRWDEELQGVIMEWPGFVHGDEFKKAVNLKP